MYLVPVVIVLLIGAGALGCLIIVHRFAGEGKANSGIREAVLDTVSPEHHPPVAPKVSTVSREAIDYPTLDPKDIHKLVASTKRNRVKQMLAIGCALESNIQQFQLASRQQWVVGSGLC
uniref:Putative secreted peptide n=1 Tax=Anopheles braziliensis TaxID=58242 RepID=A0A2M3ZU30_9DIPT